MNADKNRVCVCKDPDCPGVKVNFAAVRAFRRLMRECLVLRSRIITAYEGQSNVPEELANRFHNEDMRKCYYVGKRFGITTTMMHKFVTADMVWQRQNMNWAELNQLKFRVVPVSAEDMEAIKAGDTSKIDAIVKKHLNANRPTIH